MTCWIPATGRLPHAAESFTFQYRRIRCVARLGRRASLARQVSISIHLWLLLMQKGVFAMTCEFLKAFDVGGFKILSDINPWEAFDAAKSDTCRVGRVDTPVVSFVGDIGLQFES